MDDRLKHVEEMKQNIVEAESKYDEVLEQIRQRTSALRQEAFAVSEKLEEAGNQEALEFITATREEISKLKKQAIRDIDAQIQEAKQYIHNESETLSVAIMAKVLNRRQAS